MTTPLGASRTEELDPVAPPPRARSWPPEWLVGVLLFVSAGLIVAGCALVAGWLGFIVAGVMLAGLTVLLFVQA